MARAMGAAVALDVTLDVSTMSASRVRGAFGCLGGATLGGAS